MHRISLLPISLMALLITFSYYATAAISTVTITVSSPAIPTSTSYTNDAAFKSAMLAAHNFYRSEHDVSNLAWNDTSAAYASKWASNCVFKHSAGRPTGENLAAGYTNATAAVEAWGLEGAKYDYERPGFSESTGHFTQLVWSNTTSVGCGRTACDGVKNTPGFYVVCEYYPPGNVVGDHNRYFVDNVKPLVKGKLSSDTLESGMRNLGFRGMGEGGVVVVVVVAGVVLLVL